MIDIFSNYSIQREDILARIAENLQLDKSRRARMKSAYSSVSKLLSEDEEYFKELDIDVYAQGSVPIGTTVRPLRGDEFDLDIVVHIKRPYYLFNPNDVYTALHNKLLSDGRYKDKVEKKNRCIRLKYENDFHMDILPGCQLDQQDNKNIKIPDRQLKSWTDSNPRGYIEWFLTSSNLAGSPILESYYNELIKLRADIEELPKDDFYKKKPLQWAVQLIKRYKDIYFEKIPEYATSSIVLTTLAARLYKGENSIYETIDTILLKIQNDYTYLKSQNSRLKVLNPTNPNEDFTDKWDSEPILYEYFIKFCRDFYLNWQTLKKNFSESGLIYEKIFGTPFYADAIKSQLISLGGTSSNNFANAGSLIITNTARTDTKGNINQYTGTRNEKHRDFGNC